jgi:hypothetical protein
VVDAGLADAVVADRLAPAASLTQQMAACLRAERVRREVDRQTAPLIAAQAVRATIAARATEKAVREAFASMPRQRATPRRRPRKNIYGAF